MRAHSNMSWLIAAYVCCTMLWLASGCDPVPEDRTIEFSGNGGQVAFQHGREGIFISDPQSGNAEKVFDPDPTVIAVARPIWSQDGSRGLFTTAYAMKPEAAPPRAPAANEPNNVAGFNRLAEEVPPEGQNFFPQQVSYKCWLLARGLAGKFAKPICLFEARCDHAGYVSAGLAVRWDRSGKTILYVDQDANGGHTIWSYDFASHKKGQIFPRPPAYAPEHVIVDFTGDGESSVSVCATGGPLGGIWIGPLAGSDWWHVSESVPEIETHFLRDVLALRPAWSRNGEEFAFVKSAPTKPSPPPKTPSAHTAVFRGRITNRKVNRIFDSAGAVSNLHWSPDHSALGLISANPDPTLMILEANGKSQHRVPEHHIHGFGGWNATGNKLVYVVPEKLARNVTAPWSFLLMPDPMARDSLIAASAPAFADRQVVASGLRFTFPNWSTDADQVSVWGTFTPSHRSFGEFSAFFGGPGLTLRRGDPAVVIDIPGGAKHWLAINGDEQAQVGHYELLKHDYAQAREWYRKADQSLPPLVSLKIEDLERGITPASARRRTFELYYWYCLSRLGETDAAAAHLSNFQDANRIEWAKPIPRRSAGPADLRPETDWTSADARGNAELLVAIEKNLSIAQVFLSVDAAKEAEPFFERSLATAGKRERIGILVARSQLLLLRQEHRAYANLITDQLGPLVVDELKDRPNEWSDSPRSPSAMARRLVALMVGHAVGPLFCSAFLKEFPRRDLEVLVPKWDALRERAESQSVLLGIDLVLQAAAIQLGNEKVRAAAAVRIAKNPAIHQMIPNSGVEKYFATWRRLGSPMRPDGGGPL